MRVILKLVKRNSLNYLYDKTSIFFSFLSVFIIIFLYAAFLAQIQVDNITHLVGEIDGIRWLIDTWILAGVITANSITVPLSILSDMISDIERGKIDDFLASPISRKQIVLGYLITSWVVGILIALFTLLIGQIYILLAGGELMSFTAMISASGIIVLSVVAFSSASFFALTFIRTISAVSVINTLVGTLIGFLAGIYMPVGIFDNFIKYVIKLNPASHVASALRQVLMKEPLQKVFEFAPVNVLEDYRSFYGVDIVLNDTLITITLMVMYLLAFSLFFYSISVMRINKIKR